MKTYKNKQLENLLGEYFKPFPDNPQYLISNIGRVKSKPQKVNHNYGGKAIKKERILTQTDNGSGYLSVGLTFNGKTKTVRVSRLVAMTFLDNPENKPQVNHKNGIKYDNRAVNLEWNTSGENIRHAWNNGLSNKQSSFLYVQDRLNKINPYLTHKLRVHTPKGFGTIIIDQACYRIEYDNGKFENLIKSLRFWKDDFKTIHHTLSDLTKEIEVNGEKFVPTLTIDRNFNDKKILPCVVMFNGSVEMDYYNEYQKLFEWHFDVFNLIPENLAIDINTLKK